MSTNPHDTRYDPGDSIGIHVGLEDVEDIEDFDRFFETRPGRYSRSEQIKEAMQDRLTIQRALETAGVRSEIDDREVRHMLRSLIIDEFTE